MDYAALIEREEQAIALLRKKISEREQRIVALKALAGSSEDALDQMINRELSTLIASNLGGFQPAPATTADGTSQAGWPFPTGNVRSAHSESGRARKLRNLDPRSQDLLTFIGEESKGLDEITQFLMGANHVTRPDQSRTLVFRLKNQGVLESPYRGVYRRAGTQEAASAEPQAQAEASSDEKGDEDLA
jgi:hypothetical protein